MRLVLWLAPLTFAASCSSRDQSVGETRPPREPIIIVIDPPSPTPDPNPDPDPDPDPDPNPDPDPTPSTPPCEDLSKHARTGDCVPIGSCFGSVLTAAGYECEGDALCCYDAVGCGINGCPTGEGGGGGAMSQGGEGGDALAGLGGNT